MFLSKLLTLKGYSDKTLSIFQKVHIGKIRNFWDEITGKFFFLFPNVCIFYFCKNMSPCLHILFLVDKSMMQITNIVLRIIRSLLVNVWSFFRFSLNFHPVKEILIIQCHIYISMKKVWKCMQKWSLSLHHSPT